MYSLFDPERKGQKDDEHGSRNECSLSEVKEMLCSRFDSIDYSQAKLDVVPFIRDTASLDVWSADFFKQITIGLIEA